MGISCLVFLQEATCAVGLRLIFSQGLPYIESYLIFKVGAYCSVVSPDTSLYKNVFLSLLCYYRVPSCEHSTALFSLLGIRLLAIEAVRNPLQNTLLCASGIV